jgi:hypothetical protein
MIDKFYLLLAAVVFLLIAAAHLLRVVFGVSFVVYDIPVPMWVSAVTTAISGFLSYEGFHLARKSTPR